MNLARRSAAEFCGTAFLLMAVVGSSVMGERLTDGNVALTLLANSLATGGALIALILTFGPISGAHFNPLVSIVMAARGELSKRDLAAYSAAQVSGAVFGVIAAHAMFALPLLQIAAHERSSGALLCSEFIATFGLMSLVLSVSRSRPAAMPYAVAAYITAAYWFTASTSFANPAVTLARAFTNSFAGIRLADVAGFVAVQSVAALSAGLYWHWNHSPASATDP